MQNTIEAFLDRMTVLSNRSTAMAHLASWMTKNLRLDGRPYSFKDHEMQIQIASDQHPRKSIRKCSQVGLTELSLRQTAAIAAVARARIIYIFPSAKFSVKVSADRFTPIITESPVLKYMQHLDSKSAEMRKLGNSTVYFTGATGSTQAISIPATHIIIDEKDFCDPVILGQYNSRLRHAEEDPATGLRGVKSEFSTPTLPNYGVSRDFEDSDQKYYTVKCSKCNTVQAPDYYQDYVVPGYDAEIATFDKEHLANPKYKIDEAYVKCQGCGKDLWADLLNPDQRAWVAKYPERAFRSGYTVAPIDVPKYNKVPAIIRQIGEYTTQDHRNFVLGLPFEDKHNSFLMSIFDKFVDSFWVTPEEARNLTMQGVCMGVDMGKVAHVVIGKRMSKDTDDIHVIYAAKLASNTGNLDLKLQALIEAYDPAKVVIDTEPDFTVSQKLVHKNKYGRVFGCEYHRSVKGAFTHIDPIPEDGIVKVDRSGTLSDLMKAHNSGAIHYPKNPVVESEIKPHLKVTKKLVKTTDMGEVVTYPKPSEPDHYAHALNYMKIADVIAEDYGAMTNVVGALPGIRGVAVGSSANRDSV